MKAKLLFLNDNDEVLVEETTRDVMNNFPRAETMLERGFQKISDLSNIGEICDMCENTGKVEIKIAEDDFVEKTCPHVEEDRQIEDGNSKYHETN